MQILTGSQALQSVIANEKSTGKTIAFVPTMGHLHAGHRQLIRQAAQLADRVVVSIFVNPLQFGPDEDYAHYPRSLTADQDILRSEGVDYLFCPAVEEIYPQGTARQCRIIIPGLSDILCGVSRPEHFAGVATVVNKLFHIVQPDKALFGKKDFQQLTIIEHMVSDLCMPIAIVGVDTVRDIDGLALSSRNCYLNRHERAIAPLIHRTLQACRGAVACGYDSYHQLERYAYDKLKAVGFLPDYVSVRDARTLQPIDNNTEQMVMLVAASLGTTRLIDNVSLTIKPDMSFSALACH